MVEHLHGKQAVVGSIPILGIVQFRGGDPIEVSKKAIAYAPKAFKFFGMKDRARPARSKE